MQKPDRECNGRPWDDDSESAHGRILGGRRRCQKASKLSAMRTLIAAAALVFASAASAHVTPWLMHPTKADLRKLAVMSGDYVESQGLKFIGAHGWCRGEDPATNKSGPGFRHVRCYITTSHGYKWTVTYHSKPDKTWFRTLLRTR